VASRLLKRYKAEAKQAPSPQAATTPKAARKAAKDEMDALMLFKATWARTCGSTRSCRRSSTTATPTIEKRSIFFQAACCRCSTFGREREGIDLSALRLTAYTIKDLGDADAPSRERRARADLRLARGRQRQVQDKQQDRAGGADRRVNDLFEGELTPGDKLVYVNDVIKGKLMESREAAGAGGEQHEGAVRQLARPEAHEILGAVMDALTAHTAMSKQALAQLRADMRDVLLGAGKLWEGLREKAAGASLRN
jgi:type I restriction enzyme R subunit